MLTKFKLTVGDWSQDGHNQYDEFVFEGNKTVFEMQEAYKKSCYLTDLQFNNCNENYIKTDLSKLSYNSRSEHYIVEDYMCSFATKQQFETLLSFGLDLRQYSRDIPDEDNEGEYILLGVDKFPELILAFIKLSLPDLVYSEASFKKSELKDMEALNGWWNKNMNVGLGYGLYE